MAVAAGWQAECDYDPSRGVPFGAFARLGPIGVQEVPDLTTKHPVSAS
jgi:hypothetical protein